MTRNRGPRAGRRGFTLIELLLVVAIIALLISLVVTAAWKGFARAKQAATVKEIGELQVAIANFETAYNVPYIPSLLWLDETGAYSAPPANNPGLSPAQLNQLAMDSKEYLARVFGRNLAYGSLDWNGDGAGNTNVLLQGHACLVFFLGGIQGTQGFSTSATNPTTAGGSRRGPFVEFKPERLVPLPGAPGFFSYKDYYGMNVYAYFSSYKSQNNYNRYGISDCGSLNVQPYYEASGRFLKPNGFQIISAGPNGVFGNLSQPWTPASASIVWPAGSAGQDDLSNFYDSTLGTSQ